MVMREVLPTVREGEGGGGGRRKKGMVEGGREGRGGEGREGGREGERERGRDGRGPLSDGPLTA